MQAGVIKPTSVRKTIVAMGHRTDAATVYEKGMTMTNAKAGLERAIGLFLELNPGTKVSSKPLEWGNEEKKAPITIPADMFASFIGVDINDTEVKKILTTLGYEIKASGKNLAVTPPAWRNDVSMKQDLIEDVARIYKYAKVTPVMPEAGTTPPERDFRIHKTRDSLKENGYFELLHLAFTSPQTMKKAGLNPADAIALENPIGEELSLMRTSLLPSILETMSRELNVYNGTHVKMYEHGNVFGKKGEAPELCLVVGTRVKTALKDEPVLHIKRHLEEAMGACDYHLEFEQTMSAPAAFAHAGRSAVVKLDGKQIGFVSEVHPMVIEAFGLPGRTAIAVIDLSAIDHKPKARIASPIPAFPSVELDETLPLGTKSHGALIKAAKAMDPLLESISVVDLYEKDVLKTITLRFVYRATDRTLTQGEVEKAHEKVMGELKK